MSKLRIDEEHLNDLAGTYESFIELLQKNMKKIKDKNEDIFERYMSYWFLKNLLQMIDVCTTLTKDTLLSGHLLNHSVFNTEVYRNKNWDELEPEEHPFFMKSDDEKKNKESIPDELKVLLGAAILSKLVSNK